MKYKNILKKTLENAIVPALFLISLGTIEIERINNQNYYNSLSRQEKIVYLENELRTTYKEPPAIFRPAIVATWALSKAETIKKLERVRGEEK